MSIPGAASPLFIGAAAADAAAYEIERSLRFNDDDSAYLNRTPSSAGNRKTWTWSGWVKRSTVDGSYMSVFSAGGGTTRDRIQFFNDQKLVVNFNDSSDGVLKTSQVFRDPSAWQHIVVALDTTQATASNRLKIYVNGSQVEDFDTETYPSQNYETRLNNNIATYIGQSSSNNFYFDGYLAEVHFVDGQQLAASDFGEYDDNNVWQPKEFTGSYDQSAGGRTIANSTGAVPLLNTSDADGQTVSSGVRSDSNSANIVLALPLNGSNGGTTITDYHHTIKGSGSAKAITLFSGSSSGGAVTSTAVSKYYGSSFYVVRGGVNANQSDYITRTGDSDLNLGTGDFCVEFWFHPTSLDTNFVMFDNRHPTSGWPTSSNGFAIIGNGSGDIFLYHGGYQRINHSAKLTANTWHHIAVTRDSGTERLFVDGDFFSSTYSSSNNYNESRFLLGSSAPNGEGSTGYFQDLRIYVGAAKYTSNFNVPELGVGGVNSFYLKFDDNSSTAALGTDSSGLSNTWTVNNLTAREEKWSNYMTTTGTFLSTNGPDKSFDNSLSAADVPALDGGQTITWAPPGGLAYSSKVEIYVGGISGFTYSFNGATAVTATNNAWNVLDTGSGTINSIVFDRGINETHGPHAIRVDNVVLQDGTPSNTDSLIDTPTNYEAASGNNGGNYATMNPLDNANGLTLSNGNLDAENTAGSNKGSRLNFKFPSSGKWYIEATALTLGGNLCLGVSPGDQSATVAVAGTNYILINSSGSTVERYSGGSNVSYSSAFNSYSTGAILQIAYDADSQKLWFGLNNQWMDSGTTVTGNPSSGSNPTLTSMSDIFPSVSLYTSKLAINAGQRSFSYTPPTDFKSLCTQNLTDPTIADGSTAMDVALYTGNGSTNSITGLNFGPDFVWIKNRTDATSHMLFDIVRGVQKVIYTDATTQEQPASISVTAFNSDGFTVGSANEVNGNNDAIVAWNWDAGTSTASNTDGSITSSVRANASTGFSICTYTGSTGNQSFGHGLNDAPKFIAIKNRSNSANWFVMVDIGTTYYKYGHFNTTGAFADATAQPVSSTTVTLGNNNAWFGANGDNYVAYCWAPVAGYSAFGSYTGNGSSDGTFVHTGFRVAWLMTKRIDTAENWEVRDLTRNPHNRTNLTLFPHSNSAEDSGSVDFDLLSNGFKLRNTNGSTNANGGTYLYAAFASHPFKTARAA